MMQTLQNGSVRGGMKIDINCQGILNKAAAAAAVTTVAMRKVNKL